MKIQLPKLSFVDDPVASIRAMVSVTNDALGILQAALMRVPRSQFVSVTAHNTANTPFSVTHTLGSVPVMYGYTINANGTVYHTDDDKKEWSTTHIRVRCTVAGASLVVRVEV